MIILRKCWGRIAHLHTKFRLTTPTSMVSAFARSTGSPKGREGEKKRWSEVKRKRRSEERERKKEKEAD